MSVSIQYTRLICLTFIIFCFMLAVSGLIIDKDIVHSLGHRYVLSHCHSTCVDVFARDLTSTYISKQSTA